MPPDKNPHVPQVSITISGNSLPPEIMALLYSVEVENSLYLPSMFTLRFYDDDFAIIDNPIIELGRPISIELGSGVTPTLTKVFTGEITALEPEFSEDAVAVFVVRGYDLRHRLNQTHTQTFLNTTDTDIVKKLIGAAGIIPGKIDATGVVHEHIYQDNQSDLAFIQMLALRNSFELAVSETGTLDFRKISPNPTEIQLKWRETLRSFRPRLSLAEQVKTVEVRSWDRVTKKPIVASNPTTSFVAKIGGAQEASKGFGYPQSKTLETHTPVTSAREASNIASAMAQQAGASFAEAEGLAIGEPTLLPGVKVNILDIGTRFGGAYIVSSTRHRYDSFGYDTYFSVEGTQPQQVADLVSGTTQRRARWYGVVPAIVTNNTDPKKMNRVKIKIPTLTEDHETNWAPVVAPGAGATRGIEWLPEVNDEVLVAFQDGDINFPYVLGGMWNGKDTPLSPAAVEGADVVLRTLQSKKGHIFRMIDRNSGGLKAGLQLVDSSGKNKIIINTTDNKIEIISQGDILVTAVKKLTLKATGNVDISGQNVKVAAQTVLELTATGQTTLKGSVVNIN